MPAKPSWFHRLDEILEELRAMEISHLDRLAVQKLFRIGERRARQIMAAVPGLRVGNATAVECPALISWVQNTADDPGFRGEIQRRRRVDKTLEETRRQLAARRVRIPAGADARDRVVRDLASGIELRPGELRIEFWGAEDLAAKLFELSQAMANDWHSFARAVEDQSHEDTSPQIASSAGT